MNRSMRSWPQRGLLTLAILAAIPTQFIAQTAARVDTGMHAWAGELEPTPIEVGDALMAHQRYQAAIDSYRKAPSDSPDAWNKMGVAFQLMQNVEEASHCYQRALKLNPHNANYINNLGTIYMEHREYSRAVKAFRKAAKQNDKAALFEKNLGTALLAQKKYSDGWEAYKRALVLDPHIFEHSYGSARVENPATIQDRGAMNFYMAKGCVKAGMLTSALNYLRLAMNEGFTTPKKVMADEEFAPLRELPEFHQMMEAQGTYTVSATGRMTLMQH